MDDEKIISSIAANLNAATEDLINKIPEATFVTYFLPIFCGEEPHPKHDAVTWLRHWISIAGHQLLPVDVVDNVTGEVLYRVPSLLDRHAVTLGRAEKDTPSVTNIIMTARQFEAVHPSAGENYILKNLRKHHFVGQETTAPLRMRMWNEIFKRYGKPQIKVQEDNGEIKLVMDDTTSSANQSAGEDDLIYD